MADIDARSVERVLDRALAAVTMRIVGKLAQECPAEQHSLL